MATEFEEIELDSEPLSKEQMDAMRELGLEEDGQEETERKVHQPLFQPQPVGTNQTLVQQAPAVIVSQSNGPLFFDLETIPDFSRQNRFGFPELPMEIPECAIGDMIDPEEFISQSLRAMEGCLKDRNPPDAWLDQVLAAEKGGKNRKGTLELIEKKRDGKNARMAAEAAQHKKMSTTPEFLRIIGLAWAVGMDDEALSDVALEPTDDHEGALLDTFWTLATSVQGPVVGYNILHFDLPAILARSLILGIVPPRKFNLAKWNNNDVLDLLVCRFPSGKPEGLKLMARLYGIPIPAGDMDGSQVLETYQQNPALVREYAKSDVVITRELLKKWSGAFC